MSTNSLTSRINVKKTCHRDRIARLTAPCPSCKNFNILLTLPPMLKPMPTPTPTPNTDTGGSTIALPGLCPGELKIMSCHGLLLCPIVSFDCKGRAASSKFIRTLTVLLSWASVVQSNKCWLTVLGITVQGLNPSSP